MQQFTADDYEITTQGDASLGLIDIDLYEDRPDEDGDRVASLTLTISDAEDFARTLLDRIAEVRSEAGIPVLYVDVNSGTYGDASGIVFVNDNDGTELEDASDSEIIEFGDAQGW